MVPEDISVALTLVKASRKSLAMHLHPGSAAGLAGEHNSFRPGHRAGLPVVARSRSRIMSAEICVTGSSNTTRSGSRT
jgi:hypothetical protein